MNAFSRVGWNYKSLREAEEANKFEQSVEKHGEW
jgi:hypothetical protein